MPKLLSFTSSGQQFAWDATSISNFMRCPRYYQFVNLQGWQPVNKSVHLIFGGVYATALEHFYKYLADGATPEEAIRTVVHEALLATWHHELDDNGHAISGTGTAWDSGHASKTRDTLIRTIVWYLDQFYLSDPTLDLPLVHLDDGSPAVELSFAVPFESKHSKDILYCGHMDKVVEYNADIMVMDQKTTGAAVTAYFFEQFTLDVQMSGYTYAATVGYDIPVKGVIIDAAQIAVGFSRFGRGFVPRSKANLEEWQITVDHYIEQARIAHDSGFYPMNTSSCNDYGGCAFRKICQRSPEHRANFLAGDFVQRPRWDPLERR